MTKQVRLSEIRLTKTINCTRVSGRTMPQVLSPSKKRYAQDFWSTHSDHDLSHMRLHAWAV